MTAPMKICSCPVPAAQDRLIQFTNCRLVRGHQLLLDDLWVRDGKIINPEPIFFDEQSKAHSRIDCGGAIIAPGYLDLQINGEAVLQYPLAFHPLTPVQVALSLRAQSVVKVAHSPLTSWIGGRVIGAS